MTNDKYSKKARARFLRVLQLVEKAFFLYDKTFLSF